MRYKRTTGAFPLQTRTRGRKRMLATSGFRKRDASIYWDEAEFDQWEHSHYKRERGGRKRMLATSGFRKRDASIYWDEADFDQ